MSHDAIQSCWVCSAPKLNFLRWPIAARACSNSLISGEFLRPGNVRRHVTGNAVALMVWLFLSVVPAFRMPTATAADELVTFYPTYGFQQDGHWVIPLRAWVHERRGLAESAVTRIALELDISDPMELIRLRSRIRDFTADSESGEAVEFQFDEDPRNESFRIRDASGELPRSDLNGLIVGTVEISESRAAELIQSQGALGNRLKFHATSREHSGSGSVWLIAPQGLSVISDIDDTVKITEIPAGAPTVMKNTFLREFQVVPGMAEMYRELQPASFHYVSGGPWQLFGPIAEFLHGESAGFPEGTWHMKSVRTNLLAVRSWQDLTALITDENLTFEQKTEQITQIIRRFPNRTFILVGDSGEKDPEIYRAILQEFPQQIQEVVIRDVVHARENQPDRLVGMRVIAVPAVKTSF